MLVFLCSYEPKGPAISWKKKPEETDSMNFKCFLPGVDNAYHFIRVNRQAEVYKVRRNLPKEEFPHHFFTLHPPTVVHNLLPFDIFVEIPVCVIAKLCVRLVPINSYTYVC